MSAQVVESGLASPALLIQQGLWRPRLGGEAGVAPPGQVTGLRLWLAARLETGYADGASVPGPVDWSGRGNLYTQATGSKRPTWQAGALDGQPAFRGSAANASEWNTTAGDILAATNAASGMTLLVVGRRTGAVGTTEQFFDLRNGTTGTRFKYGYRFVAANPDRWFASGRRLDADAQINSTSEVVVDTSWHLHTVAANWSAGTADFYREQTLDAAGVAWTSAGSTSATNSVSSSVFSQSASEFLTGDIAELLVYDRVLGQAEREAVWSYLTGFYTSLAGGDATATPAVLAATAALPTISANVTAGPATVPGSAALVQPLVNVAAGPAAVAATAAVPQPATIIAAGPAALAAAASLAGPAANVGAGPAVLAAVVAVPQAIPLSGGTTVTPAVAAAVAGIVRPLVDVTAGPAAAAALVALPNAARNVAAGPAAVAAAAALPNAARNIAAGPAVVPLVVAVGQVAAGVTTIVTPATIAAFADAGMGIGGDVGAGPASLAAVVVVGQAQPGQWVIIAPAVIARALALGQATANVGASVGPAVIALAVALPLISSAGGAAVPGNGQLIVGSPGGILVVAAAAGVIHINQTTGEVTVG